MEEVVVLNGDRQLNTIILNYNKLRKSALVLRALNHELRQDIIELLNNEGELNVTDIYVRLRIEQSVASQHLAILRKAGIVETNRNGKFINYSINKERLNEIADFIDNILTNQ